jgi:hypothetical protein
MENEKLNELIDSTLNSIDGVQRAGAKPYLFTRLQAKMQRSEETIWDKALYFLSKPAVAFTCVALVVGINVAVFTINSNENTTTTDEQYVTTDAYGTDVASLNYIENPEP